jgi:hypothetical protein
MLKEKEKKPEKVSSEEQKVAEEIFCFPDYGISIKAKSREEAEEKLKDYLKK